MANLCDSILDIPNAFVKRSYCVEEREICGGGGAEEIEMNFYVKYLYQIFAEVAVKLVCN